MIQFLLNYILFFATMFAAGAPAVGGGNGGSQPGGDSGAGAGSQPGAGGGTGNNAVANPGGSPAQGAQPQGDQNIRQLREAYDGLKTKYEPWEKLGFDPTQAGQFHGVYQKLHTEVSQLGKELGYPDEEIAEALREDPVRTLDFLRNQYSQGQQQNQGDQGLDLNELVQQQVSQAIGPIQQRENARMTQEANSLFERTVHQLAAESFKAEGITDVSQIPQDEMFMLTSAVSEILKYDEGALRALKYEGKTAAIQQAFQEARNYLDKYYLARSGRERARVNPPQRGGLPPANNGQQRKPTLDDMIDNPGVISQKYA